MKTLMMSLALIVPLVARAELPRKVFTAACSDRNHHQFQLGISKLMAPKQLAQTQLQIGSDIYYSSGEHNPQGMYYVTQNSQMKRKIIFATWPIIKAQSGEVDLEEGFRVKDTFACVITGAQG